MQRDTAAKWIQDVTKQNETLKHEVTPCTLGCDLVVVLPIHIVIGSCCVQITLNCEDLQHMIDLKAQAQALTQQVRYSCF